MGAQKLPRSADGTLGLYLHIPFCERVCPYCDFAVVAARTLGDADERRYVDALLTELALRRSAWEGRRLATLYLGGGTPSHLRVESIERIVAAARAAFPPEPDLEVTLEVNPSSVERERLPGFRRAGVTRLSIGIQSFSDAKLKVLGRAHVAEEGWRTLRAAREAGFANVSLDLMFRAPNETLGELELDLDQMIAAGPDHVSAYELTIEPDTPFAAVASSGRLRRCDDDEAASMQELVERRLPEAGLQRYELASFSRPGFESRHNRRYWERAAVLGLGLGAWSSEPASETAPFGGRRSNLRRLPDYLARLESGGLPDDSIEILPASAARAEAMFLGLRRTEGVDRELFEAEFGASPRRFYADQLEELVRGGLLVENEGGDWVLTARGRLLADSVAERFV